MSRLGILTFCAFLGLFACAFAQTTSDKRAVAAPPKQAKSQDRKSAPKRIGDWQKELAAVRSIDNGDGRQEALAEVPPITTRGIMLMLRQPIETKGLHEKVKLKTAIEYFSDKFGGRLPIFVNRSAFAVEFGADCVDPYEAEVILPRVPSSMQMGAVLRVILSQVAKGEGAFILRDGCVEIVPERYKMSRHFLHNPSIITSFERRPLLEALQEFAEDTGATIHLDPNLNKRNELLVSGTFRNCSLEDALVAVTEMTQLKYVVLEQSIFVTTRENAKVIEQEEEARRKKRPAFKRRLPATPE